MSIAHAIARHDLMCQFKKRDIVQDTDGDEYWLAPVDLGVRVPCALQASTSDIQMEYAGRGISITHVLYTETDPGVKNGYLVLVDNKPVMAIQGIKDVGGLGRLFRFDVEEVV